MADISLREYLDKVDALLRSGKSDEVILHCRQILKQYPKNAAANRYLGQALVHGSTYNEAEPVLRRVLAAFPDDVVAHSALSDVHDRRGSSNEAIWHLERALEGAPNDARLIEKLRRLYQRYRKIEDPQIQLTTGAVARQYIRNGLYAQAVDTLQTTLEKSPKRIDLRLMLAETLWTADMQVEAAETALDVLNTLPYCLEANRILTLLWLAEGRPSDAQRYLNQIQEIDPYLALQLAENTTPPNDAFMVTELDYRRIAETQMTGENPDWLSEIDQVETTDHVAIEDDLTAAEFETVDDDYEDELPDDILTDLDETGMDEAAPVPGSGGTGYTGLLAALGGNQAETDLEEDDDLPASEELPDWLMEAAPQTEETQLPASFDETDLEDDGTEPEEKPVTESFEESDDALDWLNQPADAEAPDFFENVESDEPKEVDPLAWMHGSGIELLDESEREPSGFLIDDEEMIFQDPSSINPLAWMEGSGVELTQQDESAINFFEDMDEDMPARVSDADEPALPVVADNQPHPVTPSAEDEGDDSLDWLTEADLLDTEDEQTLPTDLDIAPSTSDDSMEWLHDESVLDEILDIEDLSEGPTQAADTPAVTMADDPEETVDFFPENQRGVVSTDILPGSDNREEEAPASEFQDTDWQSDMSENDKFEPQSDDFDPNNPEWLDQESEPADEPEADANALDWMTELSEDESDEIAAETGAELDWLVEDPEESRAVTSEFNWLSETDDEEETGDEAEVSDEAAAWSDDEDEDAIPAEIPDWLAAAEPEQATNLADEVEETDEAEEENFEWLESNAEASLTEAPDWLEDIEAVTEDDEETVTEFDAQDTLGWASDEESQPVAEFNAEDVDTFDWLESDEESEEPAAEPAEMPDWLASVQPEAEDADEAAEPVAEFDAADADTFDWLESDEDNDEAEAEPVEIPDWLTSVQPETDEAAEPVAEFNAADADTFDWLEDDEDAEAEAEPAEIPDWLTSVQPETEDADEAAEPVAEFDAEVSDEALAWSDDVEEPDAEPAEIPDWLSNAELETEEADEAAEPVAEFDAEVSDEALAWSDDVEEPDAEPAEIPDWLTSAEPEAEDADEAAEPVAEFDAEVSEEALAWSDDVEEPDAEPAEIPDWLSSVEPETEDADEAVEPVAEFDADISDEALAWSDDVEESDAEPAEIPDWLSSAEPEAEDADEAAEPVAEFDAEVSEEALAWSDDVEGPDAEPAEVPDWLAGIAPADADDDEQLVAEFDMEDPVAWSDEEEPEMADLPDTADLPEWVDEEEAAEAEFDAEDAEAEPDLSPAARIAQTRILPENNFDWEDEDVDEPAPAAESEPHYEADPGQSQFGWLQEAESDEMEEALADTEFDVMNQEVEEFDEFALASASAPPPADNAPDWLNAMVPGLDLDYEAIEDDSPIESTYIESPARREQPAEQSDVPGSEPVNYDWVTDIVNEETGPVQAIQDLPETGGARRRFSFSRPPSWLRSITGKRDQSADNDSEQDDDFELPEWLR
ncbi:MAG: hypothetical protein CL610_17735 [Anaerolineaceae bacterium]|nr:hypothetical protein [Anaerolineaceae bacterium]